MQDAAPSIQLRVAAVSITLIGAIALYLATMPRRVPHRIIDGSMVKVIGRNEHPQAPYALEVTISAPPELLAGTFGQSPARNIHPLEVRDATQMRIPANLTQIAGGVLVRIYQGNRLPHKNLTCVFRGGNLKAGKILIPVGELPATASTSIFLRPTPNPPFRLYATSLSRGVVKFKDSPRGKQVSLRILATDTVRPDRNLILPPAFEFSDATRVFAPYLAEASLAQCELRSQMMTLKHETFTVGPFKVKLIDGKRRLVPAGKLTSSSPRLSNFRSVDADTPVERPRFEANWKGQEPFNQGVFSRLDWIWPNARKLGTPSVLLKLMNARPMDVELQGLISRDDTLIDLDKPFYAKLVRTSKRYSKESLTQCVVRVEKNPKVTDPFQVFRYEGFPRY